MVLGMEVCTAKNSYGSKYLKIRFVWFNKDVCLVIVQLDKGCSNSKSSPDRVVTYMKLDWKA